MVFATRRLQPDALPSLDGLAIRATPIARTTPPEQADEWLPWIHIVISNLRRILRGTCLRAVRPPRLQEYIDEFVYRFKRRFRETQIRNRLLHLCVEHLPVDIR